MFDQVVFAGGGNRCWWQAGFWDAAALPIRLAPSLIAGASAGAATACLLYANDSQTALDYYRGVLAGNRRNVYLSHMIRRGKTVFPHARIYRQALMDLLGGAAFDRLKRTAPEIRVQFSRLPNRLGPRAAVALGLLAYNVEKYWKQSLHPTYGRRLGFSPEIERITDCVSDTDLVSLLIASSCTPPFTPIEHRGGRPTLDGGMVDNVPVDAVARGATTLVLVTRRYQGRDEVFTHQGRLYVQPSTKVPVGSWDYSSYAAIQQTYEQGRRDGERFVSDWARHRAWLQEASSAKSAQLPELGS